MSGPRPSASIRRVVHRKAGQQSGLRDVPAQCAASGFRDRRQCCDLGDAQGAEDERHAGFDGAAGVAWSRCGPQGRRLRGPHSGLSKSAGMQDPRCATRVSRLPLECPVCAGSSA